VTHLPKHTVLRKIENVTLLFEMTGFEENVPNFPFLAMWCFGKDTVKQCFFKRQK
jgi:hypothetical protein